MFVFECLSHGTHCLVMFLGQYDKLSRSSMSSAVQTAYSENLTPELVIFLYPDYLKNEIAELTEDSEFVIDVTRHEKSPVIFISFNAYCELTINNAMLHGSPIPISDMNQLVMDLIKSGCVEMIRGREKDVLVTAPSGTIFSKPSGKDKEEFIYASQLARHSCEYQFLAMALLKYAPPIDNIDCIHIDTASIAAVAEALTYYISRFRARACKHVSYRSYSSYSGMEESRPDNVDGAWVIISASASTSMGKEIVKTWNVKPEQVITMLSYRPLLVEADKNIGNAVLFCVDSFSRRDDKSLSPIKVQVQGENFSVEVSAPDEVLFRRAHKPDYIDEEIYPYRGAGVFHSNRQDYPVFIDYGSFRLFHKDEMASDLESYQEWLDQVVRWSIPRDLGTIVSCDSDFKNELLEDFSACLRANKFDIDKINTYSSKDLDVLIGMGEAPVLIIAPSISSGHCFVDLNRALRLAGHKGMRIFATPYTTAPSQDKFKKFRNSLVKGKNGFDYAFFTFRKICVGEKESSSWETEKKYLVDFVTAESKDNPDDKGLEYWGNRLAILQKTGDGLIGNIGVSYSGSKEGLELLPGWVFWPSKREKKKSAYDAEAVYATVCAVTQHAREKKISGQQLSSNIYQHSVISPENFVRFNDSLLQSCTWRAATPSELDYRHSDVLSTDFQRILSRMFAACSSNRGEVCLDLLVAIAIRWIKLSDKALEKTIEDADKYLNDPHAKLLIKYMKSDFEALSMNTESTVERA